MARTVLLKRIDGLEIWTTVTETAQHFAVKFSDRRARVVRSLEEAEALLSAKLAGARRARAH